MSSDASSTVAPLRQDLVRNAVVFLKDPKIQASPVAKRIEFLEAKGLTNAEVQEAISQAALSSTGPSGTAAATQPTYSVTPFVSQQYAYAPQPAPPVPQLDWRDYFIMAVVSGGAMYGLVALARKYVWPRLQPPASTAYEADRDALAAQFDAVAALVAEMQADSAATRKALEQQQRDVARATDEVENVVSELRQGEAKASNELREIRAEVDTIKELLPKMMDKTREAQTQGLSELRSELVSLKSLLLTLGPSSSGTASPVPPMPLPRPGIPAWQLASNRPSVPAAAASSTPATSSSAPYGLNGSGTSVGKAPATPEPEDGTASD
ncbi:hypothetical protein AURDEDRAFT_78799 [Auricularia subglabra TFB-10046 SS5]|nr:hypothetical protein AURDEDRAFT_78799 [Auricularia subglabra TFB-10046 SS5]